MAFPKKPLIKGARAYGGHPYIWTEESTPRNIRYKKVPGRDLKLNISLDLSIFQRRHTNGRLSLWVRKIPWRRKWQPSLEFFLGISHGQRSLAGYSPWSHKRVRHDLAIQEEEEEEGLV